MIAGNAASALKNKNNLSGSSVRTLGLLIYKDLVVSVEYIISDLLYQQMPEYHCGSMALQWQKNNRKEEKKLISRMGNYAFFNVSMVISGGIPMRPG